MENYPFSSMVYILVKEGDFPQPVKLPEGNQLMSCSAFHWPRSLVRPLELQT